LACEGRCAILTGVNVDRSGYSLALPGAPGRVSRIRPAVVGRGSGEGASPEVRQQLRADRVA